MADIIRFPDMFSRRQPNAAENTLPIDETRMRDIRQAIDGRRIQLRLFCDDVGELVHSLATHAVLARRHEDIAAIERGIRAVGAWAREAHAAAHVPADIEGLERAAAELLAQAGQASSLFTRFMKEHAEAAVGRDQAVVNISLDTLNERMARALRAQASLLGPIGRHG